MAEKDDIEFLNEGSKKIAEEYREALDKSADAARRITTRLQTKLEKMAATSDEAYRFLGALNEINDLTRTQGDLQERIFKGQVTGDEAKKVADEAKKAADSLEKEYQSKLKGSKLSKRDKEILEKKIKNKERLDKKNRQSFLDEHKKKMNEMPKTEVKEVFKEVDR